MSSQVIQERLVGSRVCPVDAAGEQVDDRLDVFEPARKVGSQRLDGRVGRDRKKRMPARVRGQAPDQPGRVLGRTGLRPDVLRFAHATEHSRQDWEQTLAVNLSGPWFLMQAALRGGDRQELHERIRRLSFAAQEAVEAGGENPLVDSIAADPAFRISREEALSWLDPRAFTGRSAEQVDELLTEVVEPALEGAATAAVESPRV